MTIFHVSFLMLFVFCLTIFCNACLVQYNIHLVLAGVVIRITAEFLDVIPASVVLIFGGCLLDALNFSAYFGGSAVIYLFFYGVYRFVLENNKNYIENFSCIMVQAANLTFIVYFRAAQMANFHWLSLILTIIFSQIVTLHLEKFLFEMSALMFPKVEKNPFNIAQNFSKNSDL